MIATVKVLLTELADIAMLVRTWMNADMPNTTVEDNEPWQAVAEHAREAFVFAASSLDDIVFEMQHADVIEHYEVILIIFISHQGRMH